MATLHVSKYCQAFECLEVIRYLLWSLNMNACAKVLRFDISLLVMITPVVREVLVCVFIHVGPGDP